MENILKITISIAIVAHVIIAGVFSYAFISQQKVNAINEVKYQCSMSVRYEVKNDKATISYPPDDLYQKCLSDRGIK